MNDEIVGYLVYLVGDGQFRYDVILVDDAAHLMDILYKEYRDIIILKCVALTKSHKHYFVDELKQGNPTERRKT